MWVFAALILIIAAVNLILAPIVGVPASILLSLVVAFAISIRLNPPDIAE